MKIYVCEDNPIEREWLFKKINSSLNGKKAIVMTSIWKPSDILEDIRQSSTPNLYFLDIDLNLEIDGIQFAKKIREIDTYGGIVFVTYHTKYMAKTLEYMVEPLGFLNKEDILETNKIEALIGKYTTEIQTRSSGEWIAITELNSVVRIKIDDILYFEKIVGKHQTILVTREKTVTLRKQLKDIKKQFLNKPFYGNFQSYLINELAIEKIFYNEGKILFISGAVLFLSPSSLKKMKKDLKNQWRF